MEESSNPEVFGIRITQERRELLIKTTVVNIPYLKEQGGWEPKSVTEFHHCKAPRASGESSFYGVVGIMDNREWTRTYCRVKRNMSSETRRERKEHWNLKSQGEDGDGAGQQDDLGLCWVYCWLLSLREAERQNGHVPGFGARLLTCCTKLGNHYSGFGFWVCEVLRSTQDTTTKLSSPGRLYTLAFPVGAINHFRLAAMSRVWSGDPAVPQSSFLESER